MKQYLELMKHVMENGIYKGDRTGTGTKSVFGYQMRFNLQDGFPIITTKYAPFKLVAAELLWFLSGSTNNEHLRKLNGNNKSTIWEEWTDRGGELGPIYGEQWRRWGAGTREVLLGNADSRRFDEGIDQIEKLINGLKDNPDSRRHIVSAWNVSDLPDESLSPQENIANGKMALAPCHCLSQFYVSNGKLSCHLFQRSADVFVGVPFNVASYALLVRMVAQQCNLRVGDFIWTGGDVHLYRNHFQQAHIQLERNPYKLPKLLIKRKPNSIFDYRVDDFDLIDYACHPHIKADISV